MNLPGRFIAGTEYDPKAKEIIEDAEIDINFHLFSLSLSK
jgi:hypothetical protein